MQLIRIVQCHSFLSPFCFHIWHVVNIRASWCSSVEDNSPFTMGYRLHQPAYIIVHPWVCIRGFSQATAWIERYKSAQKKNLQKTKVLRKKTEYLDPEVYVCLNLYGFYTLAGVNWVLIIDLTRRRPRSPACRWYVASRWYMHTCKREP